MILATIPSPQGEPALGSSKHCTRRDEDNLGSYDHH